MTIDVKDLREVSIKDYLELRGIKVERNGSKHFCSSPFSRDTNWSFCIYPNNTFYCWSTGKAGDIITLVQLLESTDFMGALQHLSNSTYQPYKHNYKKFKEDENFWKDFDINRYINKNEEEIKRIVSYAEGRSIRGGYHPGVYYTRDFNTNLWIRNPAMMFVHVDKDLNICGAKFRNIDGNLHPRFTTRGRLGFYILEHIRSTSYETPEVFLVESETSSNSLWEYFTEIGKSIIIISMGEVSSAPKELPAKCKNLQVKLIIDYDGDEKLYQERLKKYEHLNAEPIKMILPKGEDINSLYHRGEMWKIENLLK